MSRGRPSRAAVKSLSEWPGTWNALLSRVWRCLGAPTRLPRRPLIDAGRPSCAQRAERRGPLTSLPWRQRCTRQREPADPDQLRRRPGAGEGQLISHISPSRSPKPAAAAMTNRATAADLRLCSRGQPAEPLSSCLTDKRSGGLLQDLKVALSWANVGATGFEPVTPRL